MEIYPSNDGQIILIRIFKTDPERKEIIETNIYLAGTDQIPFLLKLKRLNIAEMVESFHENSPFDFLKPKILTNHTIHKTFTIRQEISNLRLELIEKHFHNHYNPKYFMATPHSKMVNPEMGCT